AGLLGDRHLDRLAPDQGRPDQLDPPAGDIRLPDRRRLGRGQPRSRDLALPLPGPDGRRDLAAAHPEASGGRVSAAVGAVVDQRWRARRRLLLRYLGLAPFLLFAGFPVYWMCITALKEVNDLYNPQNFPFWFNMAPTLEHVGLLLTGTQFPTWLLNTF